MHLRMLLQSHSKIGSHHDMFDNDICKIMKFCYPPSPLLSLKFISLSCFKLFCRVEIATLVFCSFSFKLITCRETRQCQSYIRYIAFHSFVSLGLQEL